MKHLLFIKLFEFFHHYMLSMIINDSSITMNKWYIFNLFSWLKQGQRYTYYILISLTFSLNKILNWILALQWFDVLFFTVRLRSGRHFPQGYTLNNTSGLAIKVWGQPGMSVWVCHVAGPTASPCTLPNSVIQPRSLETKISGSLKCS